MTDDESSYFLAIFTSSHSRLGPFPQSSHFLGTFFLLLFSSLHHRSHPYIYDRAKRDAELRWFYLYQRSKRKNSAKNAWNTHFSSDGEGLCGVSHVNEKRFHSARLAAFFCCSYSTEHSVRWRWSVPLKPDDAAVANRLPITDCCRLRCATFPHSDLASPHIIRLWAHPEQQMNSQIDLVSRKKSSSDSIKTLPQPTMIRSHLIIFIIIASPHIACLPHVTSHRLCIVYCRCFFARCCRLKFNLISR